MQKYGFLFNSGAQPDMSGDSSNNPGIFEDSGIVWTILPVNSLNPKRAKSSVFKIIALGLACLFLLACTPTAIPTPEPSAGSCTLNLPASASNEEAIKQVLNAEGDLVVKQDISPLMQLWAASSQVVNAKNTPDDPSDDQFWLDKDAIRNRYVRTVFPGAPATAAPADLSTEHGVADVERRQRGKQVAADVGRDVHRTGIALDDLHRREHRPLRAANAEPGRACRDHAEQMCRFLLEGFYRLNFLFDIQKCRNSG